MLAESIVTLLGITVWLVRTGKRWAWVVTGLPALWMYVMSVWALLRIIRAAFSTGGAWNPVPWVGLVLIVEGFGGHIPKGYIYGAMGFSVFVEMINLWIRRRERQGPPVKLHEKYVEGAGAPPGADAGR